MGRVTQRRREKQFRRQAASSVTPEAANGSERSRYVIRLLRLERDLVTCGVELAAGG
jgi:hypothetical protein